MILAAQRLSDTLVVAPAGRIDQSNAEEFKTALATHLETCASGKDRLVLDLSQLEYISSAGLRVLMLAGKQAKAQGGTLVLSGPQPLVAEIFQISRFTMVFTITPSLQEALAKAPPSV
jgi:anti-anti-sigma factor